MDYVVVETKNVKNYTSGLGYQKPTVLRQLGFPEAPYSQAGAKTLARQARTVDRQATFSVVEYVA